MDKFPDDLPDGILRKVSSEEIRAMYSTTCSMGRIQEAKLLSEHPQVCDDRPQFANR